MAFVKKEELQGKTKRFRQQSENWGIPRDITRTMLTQSIGQIAEIVVIGIIGFLALFTYSSRNRVVQATVQLLAVTHTRNPDRWTDWVSRKHED